MSTSDLYRYTHGQVHPHTYACIHKNYMHTQRTLNENVVIKGETVNTKMCLKNYFNLCKYVVFLYIIYDFITNITHLI